jgi:hypothetical protein
VLRVVEHHWRAAEVGSALAAAKRVVVGDLHHGDLHAVGIFDPQLDQPPGLLSRQSGDRDTGAGQVGVLVPESLGDRDHRLAGREQGQAKWWRRSWVEVPAGRPARLAAVAKIQP